MDVKHAANYHDFSGLAKLRLDAQQNSEDAIEPVARQFEGIFLQMMLKSMRDAVPEGGLFEDSGRDMYQDMHDKQLAVSLAAQGGIGLADTIVRQLAPPATGDAGEGLSESGAALRQQLTMGSAKDLRPAADTDSID